MSLTAHSQARPSAATCQCQTLLRIHGVCKRFGGISANDAISFDVARGDIVAVIGPNGSGKTSLLNGISGQQPPDAGDISFEGQQLRGRSVAAIARLGIMRTFQHTKVFDGLTSFQNVLASVDRSHETLGALWTRGTGPARDRALDCLSFVGLSVQAPKMAGELSYGQRKLLELAMALMCRPKMLLLDEPTAGVSPAMVSEVVERLRRVNAELGITVLFVEHNMQVVAELARQVHCLVRGRLVASGNPAAVRRDPQVLEAYLRGT